MNGLLLYHILRQMLQKCCDISSFISLSSHKIFILRSLPSFMFCPECGSLLYPKGKEMVCRRCGYKKTKEIERIIVSKRRDLDSAIIEEDMQLLPKTNVVCPKCGHNEAYWILRQTRAADEPETRIYTCTKCGYRWREY